MILNFIMNKVGIWVFGLPKRTMASEKKQPLVHRNPKIIGSYVRKTADDEKNTFLISF